MKKSKMSGIQKKYLKYMCTLLILALVLSKDLCMDLCQTEYDRCDCG